MYKKTYYKIQNKYEDESLILFTTPIIIIISNWLILYYLNLKLNLIDYVTLYFAHATLLYRVMSGTFDKH